MLKIKTCQFYNAAAKMRILTIIIVMFNFISLMVYYFFNEIINMPYYFSTNEPNLRYILIWTNPTAEPISYLGKGQSIFEMYHCPVNNCYVTSDKINTKEIIDFDAILFHGPELARSDVPLPVYRSSHQQYVFVSIESSHYYPLENFKYNFYFNWTWSYKLDSGLYYGYIIIKNKHGAVIGPKQNMHWLDAKEMEPIDNPLKEELSHKKLAAAWFVSNCVTPSKREQYVNNLKNELAKYNLTLDVYGRCGNKKCRRSTKDNCDALVKKKYYFYLSFENSISVDYVTEKLLTALLNNAVPIVYGGANYSRFMPDGAYLNARELGVEKLVQRMVNAINDNQTYYEFFKWRNHYTYHIPQESLETNSYCTFCSKVNEEARNEKKTEANLSLHNSFIRWWNYKEPDIEPFNYKKWD